MATSRSVSGLARSVLFFAALGVAAVGAATFATGDAHAQTTSRPEFTVGTVLTAIADAPLYGTRTIIKKGAAGKVTKVRSSGGKIVQLDIQFGELKAASVPVAEVRKAYTYPK